MTFGLTRSYPHAVEVCFTAPYAHSSRISISKALVLCFSRRICILTFNGQRDRLSGV